MKNPSTFSQTYPYLTYWIEAWGEMQTTNGDYNNSRLTLFDEGGTCYEDEGSYTIEEAFAKAEKYLRETEFPERFDRETIDEIEADYQKYNLD
jgi:hypothetical protein